MSGGCSRLRRYATVVLVLLVATQATVGTAAASSTTPGDPCEAGLLDAAAWVSPIVGALNTAHETGECEGARQLEAATHADIYASSLALEDLRESSTVPITNHVEDSRTFARTIAKAEAVKAFNNGSNLTEAQQIVNESIEDYYVTMERNVWETHTVNVNQAWYLILARADISVQDSLYVEQTSIGGRGNTHEDNPFHDNYYQAVNGTQTDWQFDHVYRNVTLLNGSNISVPMIYLQEDATEPQLTDPSNTHGKYNESIYLWSMDPTMSTVDPYAASEAAYSYDPGPYYYALRDIQNTSRLVKQNASIYVENLYSTYNQSEGIDVTEVLDPITLASQFNTNLNTTGSYGWLAAELGLTGLEGQVNDSFAINYTPRVNHTLTGTSLNGSTNGTYRFQDGETYNLSGTLFTDWSPSSTNGSYVRGETYNTSNADSPVVFISQGENGSTTVELEGNFTIDQLTDVTSGETINSTSLREYNQQTWNASSTKEELQGVANYRDSVTASYSTGGGGGGGFNFGGLSLGGAAIGGLVALGIALVVLGNGNPLSGS